MSLLDLPLAFPWTPRNSLTLPEDELSILAIQSQETCLNAVRLSRTGSNSCSCSVGSGSAESKLPLRARRDPIGAACGIPRSDPGGLENLFKKPSKPFQDL